MGDKVLLLVDDKALSAELGRHLTQWGHNPLTAAEIEEAFDLAFRHKPPLSVIDDGVGGGKGLDVLDRFKAEHPWTEAIFLVEPPDIERGARGLEYGASDFLIKPVSQVRFAIALKRAQERLATRKKLAYLSGLMPEEGQAPALAPLAPPAGNTVRESQLYDTLQHYQQLFDEVPCYISVLDEEFKITAVNRRFKEEFGDLEGEVCFEVYKGRCEGCPDCPVAETFRDGQSHQYEQVLTSASGENYNVLTWTAPLRDAKGEISQVMEMSTDITQIRTLQDHLSSLGMVIGSISHGVKGLLTALDGGMYNMRMGLDNKDIERARKGFEVAELMVGRIRRTVLDILFYAKDRALDLEKVDVADFARQVAVNGEYAARKYGLEFELKLADDLGQFEVDPNALNPAIINILENAVEACLADETKNYHKISFGVTREDDVIVLDVEDNGQGMDESIKENMFTLFFTSKGSGGTGLGLFIANDTVQQHGGTITVDSEPGQGSHFHIRIPEYPMALPWQREPQFSRDQ